jgi:hypothetical protein
VEYANPIGHHQLLCEERKVCAWNMRILNCASRNKQHELLLTQLPNYKSSQIILLSIIDLITYGPFVIKTNQALWQWLRQFGICLLAMGYVSILCLWLIVAHLYHIGEFVVYIEVLRRTIVLGPIGHVASSMGLV